MVSGCAETCVTVRQVSGFMVLNDMDLFGAERATARLASSGADSAVSNVTGVSDGRGGFASGTVHCGVFLMMALI